MKMNFVNFNFVMLNELNLAQEARSQEVVPAKEIKRELIYVFRRVV